MAVTQLDEQQEAALEEVFGWRLEQLLQAGYNARDAGRLAARRDIDLHEAVDLVGQGCPPQLAVAILR